MRYARKPLIAPLCGKIRSWRSYLKNGTKYGKKINYKVVHHHRFITKKHLAYRNDTNEKHKTHICLFALNKTALAGNEAYLSVMLKMVSFSNNTRLDTGLHFPFHVVQHDGAPPHKVSSVQQYIRDAFQQQVIGYGGCVEWPSRSPDLNPLDFFLWGYIKH
ncbi:hypothetical protein AVEN_75024-1 [Araneus ventricosus]|uniref:Tc1-like transposase DDE domain-containing protein n=1 Tax=Araneus ventricosus TaxID=182803 RepID=A0A4Y2GSI9_ARAVE|nr:hypothetical protein AVEN_75024-1 [Araneus ventricosus]